MIEVEKWLGAVQYIPPSNSLTDYPSFVLIKKTIIDYATMQSQSSQNQTKSTPQWWQSDDAWAMIMAAGVLAITWFALQPVLLPATGETSFENLLSPWVAKPGGWSVNPLTAFRWFYAGRWAIKRLRCAGNCCRLYYSFCTRARWHRYSPSQKSASCFNCHTCWLFLHGWPVRKQQ